MAADRNNELTPERIQQFAFGFAPPLILEAAVRHGVFDLLQEAPKTLQQLAAETGDSQRGLRALLDALVGLELLDRGDGRYFLNEESSTYLVSTKDDYQGGIFRHISRQLLPHWLQLDDVVRSGRPDTAVNREEVGGEFFREFVEDLFPRGYPSAQRLAEALEVEKAKEPFRMLDLAAGSGVWSIAAAERSSHVQVTAVDWPEVIPVTRKVATERGVADRYRFVDGDLLAVDFGDGYNAAVLGHILHSEGEQRSRRLLSKVFDALASGGVIAIAEIVPNEDRKGPAFALIFAVNMLVHTEQGGTFKFSEMSGWLREAGFVEPRPLELDGPSPLILATKP